MPGGSAASSRASSVSAPTTCGWAGVPTLAKTSRPSARRTRPAYAPVNPVVTGAAPSTTTEPTAAPTASCRCAGRLSQLGRREVSR